MTYLIEIKRIRKRRYRKTKCNAEGYGPVLKIVVDMYLIMRILKSLVKQMVEFG